MRRINPIEPTNPSASDEEVLPPPLVVTVAVEMAETLTVVPVAVEIAAASVLGLQLPEHPLVYAAVSETPESVIVKFIVVARLPVIDEPIEMPVLYEAHGEVHAPAAMP